eukprot:TRINITY_DN3176_c0_g1_i1.p1 TRINITY_DN3176_c0_g1~~TRINITY_DN3176_c0_g1_i1.p1  ORF type:complete len:253 (+),score=23.61 TRINITY_DN3176_c0_g1_i1:79-759(+)
MDELQQTPIPNLCANLTDDLPFCVDVSLPGYPPNFVCSTCDPTRGENSVCDCSYDQYCVKNRESPNYASCVSHEAELFGQPCAYYSPDSDGIINQDYSELQQGVNSHLFCGKAVYGPDKKVSVVEWTGICARGRCQQCVDYGAVGVHYPNIICGDRMCVSGRFTYAPALFFSWAYFLSNPVVFCCVMLLGTMSFLLFAAAVLGVVAFCKRTVIKEFLLDSITHSVN